MVQDFSFWEYDAYHQLWDVCIVGSGITGLSTGISLLERNPDLKVLVVDRWFIPLGASTRNAGFCCFGSPSEILEDIKVMGEDAAIDVVNKRWLGLQKLKSRLNLADVQYHSYGGSELFHASDYEDISGKLEYLNQLIADIFQNSKVFYEADVPEGIHGFARLIRNDIDGQLHPAFMMENLKQRYRALNGHLITGLIVEQIEEQGEYALVCHQHAFPITARKVILTANAFSKEVIPGLAVFGVRNQVFLTAPVANLSWQGSFHYNQGYYYFRNVGDRILIGGARNKDFETENTTSFGFNPVISEELERFLYTHLTHKGTAIEYRWSGIIGMGELKSPIIKQLSPRIFVGALLSGIGVATASLVGEELTDLVLQQE